MKRIAYLDDDSLERRAFWERRGMSPEEARRPAETLLGVEIQGDGDRTAGGEPRCGCATDVMDHCSHVGRCEEPVEGCGGSDVYCRGCYLSARANEG